MEQEIQTMTNPAAEMLDTLIAVHVAVKKEEERIGKSFKELAQHHTSYPQTFVESYRRRYDQLSAADCFLETLVEMLRSKNEIKKPSERHYENIKV